MTWPRKTNNPARPSHNPVKRDYLPLSAKFAETTLREISQWLVTTHIHGGFRKDYNCPISVLLCDLCVWAVAGLLVLFVVM